MFEFPFVSLTIEQLADQIKVLRITIYFHYI